MSRRIFCDEGNRFLIYIFGGNAVVLGAMVAYMEWIK